MDEMHDGLKAMSMRTKFADFKKRALAQHEVREEYDRLKEEFALLDQTLEARMRAHQSQFDPAHFESARTKK